MQLITLRGHTKQTWQRRNKLKTSNNAVSLNAKICPNDLDEVVGRNLRNDLEYSENILNL